MSFDASNRTSGASVRTGGQAPSTSGGGGISKLTTSTPSLLLISNPTGPIVNIDAAATIPAWFYVDIDGTATSTGNIVVPAKAGYYFIPTTARYIVKTVAGAISTGWSAKCGNNASHDNVFGASSAPTSITPFNLGVGGLAAFTIVAPVLYLDTATPLTIEVVTAAVGTGLTYRFRAMLFGSYVPIV